MDGLSEEVFRRLVRESRADAYAIHDNSENLRRFSELVVEIATAAECERWCLACERSVQEGRDGLDGKAAVTELWYVTQKTMPR